MAAEETTAGIERWLATGWAASLSQVLESMTGESAAVTAEDTPAQGPPGADLTWWRQELNAAPGAAAWLAAAEADYTGIGAAALKAAGIDDARTEDIRSTFLEAVSQAFSAAAQTLGAHLGREVLAEGLRDEPQPPRQPAGFGVTVTLAGLEPCRLLLAFSPELLAALTPPAAAPQRAPEPAQAPSRTMDLLLDVELPVSVSFGRTQLALKDVIKLTTGSIVELNRSVAEPVEIIVNNCVIARGEVVVLEGNYGVRIQQIVSRQERLRTLY